MPFRKRIFYFALLASIILSSCADSQSHSPALSSIAVPQAEVLFIVEVPSVDTSPGPIVLNILDEVTGLALNPLAYKMQKRDDTHFLLDLPVNLGSVLKYRYSRSGTIPIMEVDTSGNDIRYRLAVVDSPMTIYDTVPAWSDSAYKGGTGKIIGSILDITTNTPIPNMLVSVCGLNAYSSSDGSFSIANLPEGTHNMVAYALDGSYMPFQQGATIESGLTTPANIRAIPGHPVNMTFLITVPAGYEGLPIHLAGSISQLGNTFADLSGGTSIEATRMPIMAGLEDGRSYVTLSVSSGTYIEYKYTLGDGFWNSELDDKGWFKLRSLVVPAVDTIIQDEVTSWLAEGTQPINFEVTVPQDTPAGDQISIQLNPFGWMEPIPMWQSTDNHWKFSVYSPINLAGNFKYRYCRNEQCNTADDAATIGAEAAGRFLPVDTKTIQDSIQKWNYLDPTTVLEVNDAVIPYGPNFLTGIEFSSDYRPNWSPHLADAMREIKATGANTLIISPSWSCSDPEKATCDFSPAFNPTWQQTYEQIWQAQQLELGAVLFPQLHYTGGADEWWSAASRTPDWWQQWFAGTKRFLTHYADLAEQSGIRNLVIGGESVEFSLPGGILSDGSSSNAPGDSPAAWTDILGAIRSHYSGSIIWELNYPRTLDAPPFFLELVDGFYITFDGPVSYSQVPEVNELQDGFAGIIDSSVYSLWEYYGKPVYIGVNYPSAAGSARGCMTSSTEKCGAIDLSLQTEIYRAALTVVNYRDWISGFISRDFFPPVRLMDNSSSVHGKPAQDLLGYWFLYINGKTE